MQKLAQQIAILDIKLFEDRTLNIIFGMVHFFSFNHKKIFKINIYE